LCNGGYLYIDVPDAAKIGSPGLIGDVTLIHPHHLHYFSADALTALAHTSGFEVVRLHRAEGPGYPRLMALLRRVDPNLISIAVYASTVLIKRRIIQAAAKIQRLAELDGGVCIWGVGADFESLLENSPNLPLLIADRKAIRLYDGEWHGYTVHGTEIEDPSRLSDASLGGPFSASPIVMTPLSILTRKAMIDHAREGGFACRVVDPYE
jgi:hypothetical protein